MSDDTATIERDLAAVEAALASGAATHADPVARELQGLALRLSADSPRPELAFAEQLRERVETGFPRSPSSARGRAEGARARRQAALQRLGARATRGPRAMKSLARDV